MPDMQTRRRAGVIRLLSDLVACPSVNPAGRQSFGPPFGEDRLVALLRDMLESWGAKVQTVEVAPNRPNLVAFWPGEDSSRTLLFEAHGDTVGVEEMDIEPFEPVVRKGRLYGRGACDTKGPMAAVLTAIREVIERRRRPPVNVCFACTADEEFGGAGVRRLIADGFEADAAIVAEPTGLAIVNMSKGAVRWCLRTRGVAAHSATPEKGINAIEHMGHVIARITGPMRSRLHRRSHPLLGHPTVCIGKISGGTQVNVVPAECVIEIDRRMLPGEDRRSARSDLDRELGFLARKIRGFDFSIEETQYYPPLERRPDSHIVRILRRACEKHLGRATLAAETFASDAGFLDEAGIPSVVFGPGCIERAHTTSEWIEVAEVCRAVDVYAAAICHFAEETAEQRSAGRKAAGRGS